MCEASNSELSQLVPSWLAELLFVPTPRLLSYECSGGLEIAALDIHSILFKHCLHCASHQSEQMAAAISGQF